MGPRQAFSISFALHDLNGTGVCRRVRKNESHGDEAIKMGTSAVWPPESVLERDGQVS